MSLVEHLDLKELAKRNIKIGYTPDVLTDAGTNAPCATWKTLTAHLQVADITVMLALMAGRNARETMTIVNDGKVSLTPTSIKFPSVHLLFCSGPTSTGDPSFFAGPS